MQGLVALEQWVCDKCGEVIEKPSDGWLEWYSDADDIETGFRIVHHHENCMYNERQLFKEGKSVKDMHLEDFLGSHGLSYLLDILEREQVADKSDVAEVIRRLHVRGYEQERLNKE